MSIHLLIFFLVKKQGEFMMKQILAPYKQGKRLDRFGLVGRKNKIKNN
jgi:hypothetical protein